MLLPATRLRSGMIIKFNGVVCRVTGVQHVTPGKGHGMVQAKMKNLDTGTNIEHRFRSDERFEKAFLEKRRMQYLYSSDDDHVFMDLDSFEQIHIGDEEMGDNRSYLVAELEIGMEYHEGKPVGLELPTTVELKIAETEPQLKGATASASFKPATLETGLVVQVPPYLDSGQRIKIDTRDGTYIGKAD